MQDKFDRDLYSNANRADSVAVAVAFLLTVLLHVGVYYTIPYAIPSPQKKDKPDALRLEILPPKLKIKRPEFIEANPFGNDQKPESPDAPESFKDQRAADEIPDPTSKSRKPFVAGDTKDSQKIVSGTSADQDALSPEAVFSTLERPLVRPAQPDEFSDSATEAARATPDSSDSKTRQTTRQPDSADSQQAEQRTDSVDSEDSATPEKSETSQPDAQPAQPQKTSDNADSAPLESEKIRQEQGDSDDAFLKVVKTEKNSSAADKTRGKVADKTDAQRPSQTAKRGAKQTQHDAKQPARQPRPSEKQPEQPKPETEKTQPKPEEPPVNEDLPAPKPRPMLSMRIPAGPLAENNSHASARGVVACDSRFSEFGAYQQRMIEAISRQWNLLASKYDLGTAVGTIVQIEFYLDSSGALSRFKVVFSNSTNTGSGLCEQSILTTAPYGEWTQEMVNTFGNQDQSVKITFHYR